MQYELFYLVGERQETNLEAIKEGVNAYLVAENATMVGEELSEKRKLAYEIKHQTKGIYITRRFELPEIDFWADEANSEKEFGISAITNKMNLNNDVLRFIIVKTQDLPDLGAKDRRKAQEMNSQRPQGPQRTPRGPQRDGQRPQRPMQQQRPMAPKAAVEAKPKVETDAQPAKEGKDNIDKQLDALLG